MPINRNITVTRKGIIAPIVLVYGTDLLPFEFRIMDYDIPNTAIATAYSESYQSSVKKQLCEITENTISFTPNKDFFAENQTSILQIRITDQSRDLITFDVIVKCTRSIVDDDAEEIQSNPTLLQQLLSEQGMLRERLNAALQIPEGGTTADAALNDIKVGANGEVYDSPGDAVRRQVANLEKKFSNLSFAISADDGGLDITYKKE